MKKIGIICIALGLSITACAGNGESRSQSEAASQTSSPQTSAQSSASVSKIDGDLAKAKKNGEPVFVVVKGNGASNVDKALETANQAAGKTSKKATVLQLDRDDAENKTLVKEWGLSGAPLPIIMCVSPKGNVTGGFLMAEATPDNLANSIPSPKYDDVYTALNQQKAAYVIVGNPSDAGTKKLQETCGSASKPNPSMEAVTIIVDPNDKAEQGFIKSLSNGQNPKTPTVYVINRQGRVVASYDTSATKIQLQNSAMLTVGGACCGDGGC